MGSQLRLELWGLEAGVYEIEDRPIADTFVPRHADFAGATVGVAVVAAFRELLLDEVQVSLQRVAEDDGVVVTKLL